MEEEEDLFARRRPWRAGPDAPDGDWMALDDDDLLHRIETLAPDHSMDDTLVRIVCSNRHFFIRQEAAKRVRDMRLLKDYEHDRHVGQILARRMSRIEDLEYLERLAMKSRHLDVRKSAQAQLSKLKRHPAG
ncbi:MAG: hypothetical protein JXO72_15805 [Vicinamibacteria bacterium]|nr:hypothetical protein [Vicinamibacteria bacterium]